MTPLFVVQCRDEWPRDVAGATVVDVDSYLAAAAVDGAQRVVNLCSIDRHHGHGFYVSLVAEARGQRPLPDVRTIEDLTGAALPAPLAAELEDLVAHSVAEDRETLELRAYFGHDPAGSDMALAQQIFNRVQVPLLRAGFRREHGRWRLDALQALTLSDIGASDVPALVRAVARFTAGQGAASGARPRGQPSIAILHDPAAPQPPSNALALEKFLTAASQLDMRAEIVDHRAFGRLAEFDALFIRDTTWPNHYTYRFSRQAAALGLVVIDHPDSILQCNNKVYLHELVRRHGIPDPRTLLVQRNSVEEVIPALGLPCILKQPDSAFSVGVYKAETEAALRDRLSVLLAKSELVVAQEYLPTPFDWRIGVLDRRVLFACRYYMAPGHWQVHKHEPGRHVEGRSEAVSIGEVPSAVVRSALELANLIGDGLYGIDVKEVDGRCYVMEINDNPNVDAGNEDGLLGDALYREIMGVFRRRVLERALQRAA